MGERVWERERDRARRNRGQRVGGRKDRLRGREPKRRGANPGRWGCRVQVTPCSRDAVSLDWCVSYGKRVHCRSQTIRLLGSFLKYPPLDPK